jgi:hypothetical protein
MSSPAPLRLDGPSRTRDQLDELDGLIQRMLALPVDDAAEGFSRASERALIVSEPAPQSVRGGLSSSEERADARREASLPVAIDSPCEPVGLGVTDLGGGRRTVPVVLTGRDAGIRPIPQEATKPRDTAVLAEPVLPSRREIPGRTSLPPAAVVPQPERPRRSTLAVVFNPFLASNLAFDGVTASLGTPGRWLQGPWGRAVLGCLGLAMLAGALWMALERLGWTW